MRQNARTAWLVSCEFRRPIIIRASFVLAASTLSGFYIHASLSRSAALLRLATSCDDLGLGSAVFVDSVVVAVVGCGSVGERERTKHRQSQQPKAALVRVDVARQVARASPSQRCCWPTSAPFFLRAFLLRFTYDVILPSSPPSVRHETRRSRDLPGNASPQASHDVLGHSRQGHPDHLQEVYGQRMCLVVFVSMWSLCVFAAA